MPGAPSNLQPIGMDAKRIQRIHTYTHRSLMGSRNISISDEAYDRLTALKHPKESFTDVINRLAGKRSILELAGILTKEEAREVRKSIDGIRAKSRKRVYSVAARIQKQ